MRNAVEKARARAGGERILLTERGTHLRLPRPGRGHARAGRHARAGLAGGLRRHPQPAAPGRRETGGDRRFALPLLRAAVACGVDGLFFETHPDPARARSDAATQLPLEQAAAFLDEAVRVRAAVGERP